MNEKIDKTKRRRDIIDRIDTFPSIPTAAVKAKKLLSDPEVDFDELARIIKFDQALTANLLHIANTITFGGKRKVTSAKQAILRLGTRNVSQMILGIAAAPILKREVKGYDLPPQELWKHAIAVAMGSEALNNELQVGDSQYIFTAGLLHDIGKVALGTFLEEDGERIRQKAYGDDISFEKAEEEILGIDHAELGSLLLEHWDIPEELVRVTRWHHAPDECPEPDRAVDTVHVADALSLQAGVGTGRDELQYSLSRNATERLHIDRSMTDRVMLTIGVEIEELEDLFIE
ncbi:MAG: HDOD domain-containing protein [Planctomycetota bacterium]